MTIIEAIIWIAAIAGIGATLGLLAYCVWIVVLAVIEFINFLIDVLLPDEDTAGPL